jgi:hypothetical protein
MFSGSKRLFGQILDQCLLFRAGSQPVRRFKYTQPVWFPLRERPINIQNCCSTVPFLSLWMFSPYLRIYQEWHSFFSLFRNFSPYEGIYQQWHSFFTLSLRNLFAISRNLPIVAFLLYSFAVNFFHRIKEFTNNVIPLFHFLNPSPYNKGLNMSSERGRCIQSHQ